MAKVRITKVDGLKEKPADYKLTDTDSLLETGQVDLTPVARELLRANKGKKTACLVVLQGTDVGSIIPLDRPTVLIGRKPDCDAVMREEGISRTHAEIEMSEGNRVVIRDLGSTNGTFVEGKRIKETTLESGDKVLLGRNTVLKFVFQDQIDLVYQQEMYDSTIRDGLTGAYNRKYFSERIVTDLSFTRRHQNPLTFIIFDIDKFKNVNDAYGHQTGDHVLISIANSITQMIRTEDVFARYGGEEFALISANLDFEGAKILGERIRKRVESKRVHALDGSGEALKITVSVGVITVGASSAADSFAVVAAADRNLYRAKENGRNQMVATQIE